MNPFSTISERLHRI